LGKTVVSGKLGGPSGETSYSKILRKKSPKEGEKRSEEPGNEAGEGSLRSGRSMKKEIL